MLSGGDRLIRLMGFRMASVVGRIASVAIEGIVEYRGEEFAVRKAKAIREWWSTDGRWTEVS